MADYGNTYVNTEALIYAPANLGEIRSLLKAASREHRKIRIRGAGHSISGFTVPRQGAGDVVLSTDNLSAIEGHSSDGTLTVQSGVRITVLQEYIRNHMQEYFLPVYPDAPGPTVGGFFHAGGVNPSSYRNAGFWQWVTAVKLVDGHGEVRELRPQDEDFWYLPASTGQLGLVFSLTLRLKKKYPAFDRQSVRELSIVSPAKIFEAVEKFHQLPGMERVFAISDNGILHLRIEGDDAAIPEARVTQPRYAKEPGYSIKWFNLLLSSKDFVKGYRLLDSLRRHLPAGDLGIYFYKIAGNGRLPRLLFKETGDHWLMGIWYRDADSNREANVKFAAVFETARHQAGFQRYFPTELLPEKLTYADLVTGDILDNLRNLKRKFDPGCVFGGGIRIPGVCEN